MLTLHGFVSAFIPDQIPICSAQCVSWPHFWCHTSSHLGCTLRTWVPPPQVRGFSESADGHRAMKKHAEMIGSLQKGLASLEARLVDYQVSANSGALHENSLGSMESVTGLSEATICVRLGWHPPVWAPHLLVLRGRRTRWRCRWRRRRSLPST